VRFESTASVEWDNATPGCNFDAHNSALVARQDKAAAILWCQTPKQHHNARMAL